MRRNLDVLQCILTHCKEIEGDLEVLGKSKEAFCSNPAYQSAISFSLLQIGELAGKLTDRYIELTANEMDWKTMKNLRDLLDSVYTC